MSSTIFFFLFIPLLAFILLAVNLIFAPHNPYMEKNSAFECGFSSFLGQNRTQFSISFFIFALLFLLFDLEILLVYPYLVSAYTNGVYGLVVMLMFLLALTLGFAFELGKKALFIDSRQMSNVSKSTNNKSNYISKVNTNVGLFLNTGKRHYSTKKLKLGVIIDILIFLCTLYGRVQDIIYAYKSPKIYIDNKISSYMQYIILDPIIKNSLYVKFKGIYYEKGLSDLLSELAIHMYYVTLIHIHNDLLCILIFQCISFYMAHIGSNFFLIIWLIHTITYLFLIIISLLTHIFIIDKNFKKKHPILFLAYLIICLALFVILVLLLYKLSSELLLWLSWVHINTPDQSDPSGGPNESPGGRRP